MGPKPEEAKVQKYWSTGPVLVDIPETGNESAALVESGARNERVVGELPVATIGPIDVERASLTVEQQKYKTLKRCYDAVRIGTSDKSKFMVCGGILF